MTKPEILNTLSVSISDWTEPTIIPRVLLTSNTNYELSDQVVLVQGKYIKRESGDNLLVVSVDPASIERKLAIRELNAQLEGRTIKSQTDAVIY